MSSLKLIYNSVYPNSQLISLTSANVDAGDSAKLASVAGGGRHLAWLQSGTAGRKVCYINTDGLTADTFILVNASAHLTKALTVFQFNTYTSSVSNLFTSASFAETLIGYSSSDFVKTFPKSTGVEGFGLYLSSTYAKTINKVIFGESIEFLYGNGCQMNPSYETIQHGQNIYLTQESISLPLTFVTRTQIQSLQYLLDRKLTCFLYDLSGELFTEKLKHGIITSFDVTATFDDTHNLNLSFQVLRHY